MFREDLIRLRKKVYKSVGDYFTGKRPKKKHKIPKVKTKKSIIPWVTDYAKILEETIEHKVRSSAVATKEAATGWIRNSWYTLDRRVRRPLDTLGGRTKGTLARIEDRIITRADYDLPHDYKDHHSEALLIKRHKKDPEKGPYYELCYSPRPSESPIWLRVMWRERFDKYYLRFYRFKVQDRKSTKLCYKVAFPREKIKEESLDNVILYYFEKAVRGKLTEYRSRIHKAK